MTPLPNGQAYWFFSRIVGWRDKGWIRHMVSNFLVAHGELTITNRIRCQHSVFTFILSQMSCQNSPPQSKVKTLWSKFQDKSFQRQLFELVQEIWLHQNYLKFQEINVIYLTKVLLLQNVATFLQSVVSNCNNFLQEEVEHLLKMCHKFRMQ